MRAVARNGSKARETTRTRVGEETYRRIRAPGGTTLIALGIYFASGDISFL